ncbi:alpha/beta hydrolase [Psychroflexus montanilacus]|uniref:alpha/beta hydrolase n=1 Tax=Psychroflexus montanilacus TaxID=2873598 RepID=UPI001CCDB67D|nr:alpha/beta fold hydrolase [Psychroflexus montanilacus]MBZ9650979.1 alpha/beta fold hydrolase [Psychroflexus montanilacus]
MKKVSKLILIMSWMLWISPQLSAQSAQAYSIENIEQWIEKQESNIPDLKKDNNAMISWAKDPGIPTDLVFVYLHGFGASRMEAEPVISKLAKAFEANVFYARLKGHGRSGVEGFKELTKEKYLESAEEALDVGRRLGKKVILISTSTGGTLSLHLASKHDDIAGLVMYSPFVGLKNPMMSQITTDKGREMFKSMIGGEVQKMDRPEPESNYWSTEYHINAYVALIGMLKETMTPETFKAVECPVFMAYYYKNEDEQDKVVSVQAMLEMYDQLGTPKELKQKQAFPETGNHVIASDLRSKDWESVLEESQEFINDKIKD